VSINSNADGGQQFLSGRRNLNARTKKLDPLEWAGWLVATIAIAFVIYTIWLFWWH
jgi:hypothetical protein